jgi:hypothetical protein
VGCALAGVVSGIPQCWEWEDVRATTGVDGVQLAHAREAAELRLHNGRLVRGAGYESASRGARRSLARVGAILRLRARGRYLVHASAVVDPSGGAWLLAGDSGSGKSTLAWVLVRHGWALLGDDGVLIEAVAGRVLAHAWREPLRVSLALAARFAELDELTSRMAVRDARARVPLERDIVRHAPVRAILFLQRAERDQAFRVSPSVALASLVRQSPWVLVDDGDAPSHLSALAGVAASVPAFAFAHTESQLEELPRTLASLM